ncbi:hypothetical protein ACI3PL_25150, partial [Lacticaseibacillus paracasei]
MKSHGIHQIQVGFEGGRHYYFTSDGRYFKLQKPSLIFISRPKKKITKHMKMFVNVYLKNFYAYPSREKADAKASAN